MTSRLAGMATRNIRIFALIAGASSLWPLAPTTLAQDPIRVQTDQVLVPVYVIDKKRDRLLKRDPSGLIGAILASDIDRAEAIEEGVVIRGLAAADFHLFDDGNEQAIQNVAYERRSLYWDVRDNTGYHTEYIGPGGGKWSTAEWPPGMLGYIGAPHYLIAYALPDSPEGSCHQIRVKVNRRNALVAARSEYCNTKHSASDPLNGTKLGEQMERYLVEPKSNNVDLELLAVPLYTTSDATRVHIALDWPWESLRGKSRTKGVLGMILHKDGNVVSRFSDFAAREAVSDPEWPASLRGERDIWPIENRYEAQFFLPPGEYQIRAVLSDGTRFGRAEVPITIDGYERKDLAVSAVSLCKQISDVSAYSPQHPPKLPGAWGTKPPGSYVPLISNDIEFKPTGDTRFKKGATLYTYFEVYEPSLAAEPLTKVEIQIRVVDLKTGEVKSDSQAISATPYVKAGSPVIPIGRGINISNLPKGPYRLDVQATDSAGKSTPWRSANFTVE